VAHVHGWRSATATEGDEYEDTRVQLVKLGSCDARQQATGSPSRVASHLADAAGRVVAERKVVSEGGEVAAVKACVGKEDMESSRSTFTG
jgi:ribosomal protein L35AE/L33A